MTFPVTGCQFPARKDWKLATANRELKSLALPFRRVPTEDPVLLHRLEREQRRQCRVVADVHRRTGLPVLRLHFVEEVARVRVQRVILFDAAARVDEHVHLDSLPAAAAAAESAAC